MLSLYVLELGAQLGEHYAPQLPFWIRAAACAISIPIAWFKFGLPAKDGGASSPLPGETSA